MVEKARYDVIRALGKIEIRRYPKLILARVKQDGDSGFGILFSFITGKNRQKTKVEMTAPVISEQIEMTAPVLSEGGSIAFIMPEGYTLETTPEPIDERVQIVELPERTVAVLRFSGRWSESAFDSRSKELLERLGDSGLKTKGNIFTMLYNPPYTPWFLRRNEVAIEVASS